MSVAVSMMARLHHNLLLAFSPSYRQVRARLEALGERAR